jgi:uncharacterized protein with HEPN domain
MTRVYIDYLNDIMESINDIEIFTKNINCDEFVKDRMRRNAVVRSLEIIGEAVKNLPEEIKNKYPEIPWKRMAGMRDKLIHGYFGVDYEAVWAVAANRLNEIKPGIAQMIKEIGNI